MSLTAHLVVLHCEFYYIPDSKFLTLYGLCTQKTASFHPLHPWTADGSHL